MRGRQQTGDRCRLYNRRLDRLDAAAHRRRGQKSAIRTMQAVARLRRLDGCARIQTLAIYSTLKETLLKRRLGPGRRGMPFAKHQIVAASGPCAASSARRAKRRHERNRQTTVAQQT